MKLLLAIAITTFGLVILLLFLKPNKKELEAIKNLDEAKKDLFEVIVTGLKIPQFVEWLNKKLK